MAITYLYHSIWNENNPNNKWGPGLHLVVHHKDGNRENNSIDNLELMTLSEHSKLHQTGRKLSEDIRKRISDGHKGKIVSEETRKNMSKAQKGKIVSAKARINISNAQKGKKHSIETRRKMSESRKGKLGTMLGKKHTEEAKKKIGLSGKTAWILRRKKLKENSNG